MSKLDSKYKLRHYDVHDEFSRLLAFWRHIQSYTVPEPLSSIRIGNLTFLSHPIRSGTIVWGLQESSLVSE